MIRRYIPSLLAFLLLLGALPAASSVSQQSDRRQIEEEPDRPAGQAALRVDVEQVRVDVTVQDRNGNLIQGLQKENFRIYEERVQQEIVNFTPIEAPMTAVLITEYSRVLPWELLYESWLASHVFVEQLRRDDWLAIVAYDLRPEILADFTQNKFEAYNALRRLNFPAFSESNLYDTVTDVLERLEEVDGKTSIILISTGLDTFSKKTLGQTLDVVKNSATPIYAVSLGGNLRARADHRFGSTLRMDFHQADATLRYMARYTGGESFFPRFTQAFPGIFETISAMLRHQYSLSYVPTDTKRDGKYRKIRVEVAADIDGDGKPDKLKVNHREGYFAAKD